LLAHEIMCCDGFDLNDTVLSLKLKIQEKIGLHPRKQILSFCQEPLEPLEDFRSLNDYIRMLVFGHFHFILRTQDVNFMLNMLTDFLLQLDDVHPYETRWSKQKREWWLWTDYLIRFQEKGTKEQEEERVRFAFTIYFKKNAKDAKQIKKKFLFAMNEVEDTTENLAILKEVIREVRPDIELIENDDWVT